MPMRQVQYTFAGGEVTPKLTGRMDVQRYFASLARCENWRTLPQGGVATRPPLEFIAQAKYGDRACRLERFEFSIAQAYIVEMGHEYIRFYTDGGRLEVAGVPVEVATPYQDSELFDIQVAQSADVLYLVHPHHAPRKLNRLSDTSWELKPIAFVPPPVVEAETDLGTAMVPLATAGRDVTVNLSAAVLLDGDIDRHIVAGDARAIITALLQPAPSAACLVTVLQPFSSTDTIGPGGWFLTGSPAVGCVPNKVGPVGAEVTLTLEKIQENETELISNGDFSADLTGYTDLSRPLVTSGTADGDANPGGLLIDLSHNFLALGVETGHRAFNLTDGVEGRVDSLSTTTNPNDTITLNPTAPGDGWDPGDAYEIRQSGSVVAAGGECRISGGDNGVGWLEKAVPTQAGKRYRWLLDIRDAAVSTQVGSTSGASDIQAEAAYNIGNAIDVRFTASAATTYLQVRNNQNTTAVVDNLSCKALSAPAFRGADVGKYVQLHGGTVEITQVVDSSTARGVIWWPLQTDEEAPATAGPGTWVLAVPAWSQARGYPRTLSFHSNRLYYLGTQAHPLGTWGSVPGKYETFAQGPDDDQSVEFEISANTMNTIEWAEPLRDLIVGTRGGEHQMTGGTQPITPDNIGQIPLSSRGSPPLRPLRIDSALLHLQRGRRRVRELDIDVDTARAQTRDLTLLAEHITTSGITQWAYQAQPVQTIWAVRRDGGLIGLTHEILEDVRGWHRHPTPGGLFESVAVRPVDEPPEGSDITEEVWVSVKRTCASGTFRSIERLLPSCRYLLDSHLSYSGAPATVFSGLDHLNGCAVTAVADGYVAGTHTVVSGQITLETPASAVTVGLQYTPTFTTLTPELGLGNGSMQGRKQRWVKAFARVLSTLGLTINGKAIATRTPDDAMDTAEQPIDADLSTLLQGWSRRATLTVSQTLPYAAEVVCLFGDLEIEELK